MGTRTSDSNFVLDTTHLRYIFSGDADATVQSLIAGMFRQN